MSADGGERVFVLGAGRAGRGLARALRQSATASVVALHGRRPEPGEDLVTAGPIPTGLLGARVALVAVRDAQLDAALDELLAARPGPGAVILHASGSAEPAAFERVRAAGYAAGTFHPLLPLAEPTRAPALLHGAWIGIDGDAAARAAARRLAVALGARTLEIPPGEKGRYHAAAVIASNFPTVLAATAERLLRDAGIDTEAAHSAVLSLMAAAVSNLRDQPPAQALTGPVVRGDAVTVRRHLDVLARDESARESYLALSRAALDLVDGGAGRDEVRQLLDAELTARPSSRPDRTP